MKILDRTSKTPVLIPTQSSKYPFLIKVTDKRTNEVEYWLVNKDGVLTGDGFTPDEKDKYPELLSNI